MVVTLGQGHSDAQTFVAKELSESSLPPPSSGTDVFAMNLRPHEGTKKGNTKEATPHTEKTSVFGPWVVCVVWHAEKNPCVRSKRPPCVLSRRPRVYRHHAHMFHSDEERAKMKRDTNEEREEGKEPHKHTHNTRTRPHIHSTSVKTGKTLIAVTLISWHYTKCRRWNWRKTWRLIIRNFGCVTKTLASVQHDCRFP